MDWVPTVTVIDPDHHHPSAGRCPTDHLMRLAIGNVGLDPISIAENLLNFQK